ncbi:MAG: hypothetical protein ABI882_03490 [Acidobacteriota bacterium]
MSALFNLLPAVYRLRDAAKGDPLRAILDVIEREADRLENDISGLYDNWYIETCDEWVVPYIADLLGVRNLLPVSGGTFSQRSYVANTLGYRRRKGTAAVLEQLGRDVTGWPSKAVEFFERIATTQHLNHVRLSSPATTDIRSSLAMQSIDSPFEEATRTAEVRHIDNGRGRHNIPNLGIFLWRLQSYLLRDVTCSTLDAKRFTFDVLGRSVALFNVPASETDITDVTGALNVPMPISRLAIHDDRPRFYGSADEIRSLILRVGGVAQGVDDIVVCNLSDAAGGKWAHEAPAGKVAIDPQLGRIAFSSAPAGKVQSSFAYGFGGDLGGGPYDRRGALAAAIANVTWQMGVLEDATPAQTQLVTTLTAAVKEWNKQPPGTRGLIVVMDNATYAENLTTIATRIRIPQGSQLTIAAAGWPEETRDDPLQPTARIIGHLSPDGLRAHLKGKIEVLGTAPAGSPSPGKLIINGALIEGSLSVVEGNLGGLEMTHCTLVPETTTFLCKPNPELRIDLRRSITGEVKLAEGARAIALEDCLVAGAVEGRQVSIEASTVLGKTSAEELTASNSILVGKVTVERRQVGCVRFSYLPFNSEVPRRFHCQPKDVESSARLAPQFASTDYSHPAYGQLAKTCAVEIANGADDEGEMGVWHFLHAPQRLRNLELALDEYLRFGLEAGVLRASQESIG